MATLAAAAGTTPTTPAPSPSPSSPSDPAHSPSASPPPPAPAEEQERDSSLALFLVLSLLIFSFFASYYLRVKRITAIHETIVGLFAGVFIGIILRLGPGQQVQSMLSFSNTIMLNVLLPPIILASGYDLRQESFFRNFGVILAFAFAGTFISAIVIGVLVYLWSLADFTISLTFLECLIFGSTLSATDPVTILSIFNSKKVDPTLYSIIFGESLLNDAVSIVMFDTLSKFRGQSVGISSVFHGIGLFLVVFTVSMALGVAFGLACSLMLKHSRLSVYPQLESSLVALIAYTSYFFSNAVTMSGIVSLLFCGITLKHYAYHNMSRRTQRATRYTFQTLASLSENFIFIYLGLSLFTQENLVFKPLFIVVTVASVVFSRYAAVFPIASLVNFLRRLRSRNSRARGQRRDADGNEELSREYQIMLFWAGLRGAVGFALSAGIVGENALALQTTVLVTIVLTLIVFGGTTPQMLGILNIRTGVQDDEGDSSDEDEDAFGYGESGMGMRANSRDSRSSSARRRGGGGGAAMGVGRGSNGRSVHGVKHRGAYHQQGTYRDDESLFGSQRGSNNGKGGDRYSYEEDGSDSSDVLPLSHTAADHLHRSRASSSSLAGVAGMGSGGNVHGGGGGGGGAAALLSPSDEVGGNGEDGSSFMDHSSLPFHADNDEASFYQGGGGDEDDDDDGSGAAASAARRSSSHLGGIVAGAGGAKARALLEQGALIMRDGQWFQRIDDRYLKPYFSNAVASRRHQQRKTARMATTTTTTTSGSAPSSASAARGGGGGGGGLEDGAFEPNAFSSTTSHGGGGGDDGGIASAWEAEAAAREPDADVFTSNAFDDDDDVEQGPPAGVAATGAGRQQAGRGVSGAFA
ncbi:unnamed protein product [Parajaminaea phylloscopi]